RIDRGFLVRGGLDRLDGQRRGVHQEVEAIEPMPISLLACETCRCPSFSSADRIKLRTAFGISTVCDRLPELLAIGNLADSQHCVDRKTPHEESVFHDIVSRSMDSIPPISVYRDVIVSHPALEAGHGTTVRRNVRPSGRDRAARSKTLRNAVSNQPSHRGTA